MSVTEAAELGITHHALNLRINPGQQVAVRTGDQRSDSQPVIDPSTGLGAPRGVVRINVDPEMPLQAPPRDAPSRTIPRTST